MGNWIRVTVYFVLALFFLWMVFEEAAYYAVIPAVILFGLFVVYWVEMHGMQRQKEDIEKEWQHVVLKEESTMEDLVSSMVPVEKDRLDILLRFNEHIAKTGSPTGFILVLERDPNFEEWSYGGYSIEIKEDI